MFLIRPDPESFCLWEARAFQIIDLPDLKIQEMKKGIFKKVIDLHTCQMHIKLFW